ncbi:hypothetical protein V5O48_013537 [Marasmius crinis-equi]|uniref:Uncharacterized protein n=1 Tax=Marasmius crinis-equi TaxID=585013 RepID=A0ABR3EZU8_9AGAR
MHNASIYSSNPGNLDTLLSGYSLPTSLKTLSLGGAYDDLWDVIEGVQFLDRWICTHCPVQLSAFSVYKVNISSDIGPGGPIIPNIEPLLVRCQSLRFLHVGIDSWHTDAVENGFYDLSAPQHLERLIISIRDIVQDSRSRLLLNLVSRMIDTLTSPRLRSITLNASGSSFRVIEEKWDALDALLASSKFALVTIELVVPFSNLTIADGTEKEDLSLARSLFMRCDRGGRLRVIRAPFVVTTRTWKDIPNREVIDWVCEGKWRD